jgi:hypothetical protein
MSEELFFTAPQKKDLAIKYNNARLDFNSSSWPVFDAREYVIEQQRR